MTRAKVARCVLIVGAPLTAVSLLVASFHDPEGQRAASGRGVARVAVTQAAAIRRPVETNVVAPARAGTVLASAPRSRSSLADDGSVLVASVLEIDRPDATVKDLQDLGSTLKQLLMQRPELGPAAASLLPRLKERDVLFQVSLALRAVVDEPIVRARLLEMASNVDLSDQEREAAIRTLGGRGDASAADAFSQIFSDPNAPDLTRSAAAYQLGRDLAVASPDARARALGTASNLIDGPAVSERVRAEAIDLLGIAGLDDRSHAVALTILGNQSTGQDLALAAARALLRSGESRSEVASALRTRVQGNSDEEALVDLLDGKERTGTTARH